MMLCVTLFTFLSCDKISRTFFSTLRIITIFQIYLYFSMISPLPFPSSSLPTPYPLPPPPYSLHYCLYYPHPSLSHSLPHSYPPPSSPPTSPPSPSPLPSPTPSSSPPFLPFIPLIRIQAPCNTTLQASSARCCAVRSAKHSRRMAERREALSDSTSKSVCGGGVCVKGRVCVRGEGVCARGRVCV